MKTKRSKNILKAHDATLENIISCRYAVGTQLDVPQPWEPGKPVEFIYAPGGITTLTCGFRKNETITCTVEVDENTAKDLQQSFDHLTATDTQEPYADEDHEARKATLRFPKGNVQFVYGTIKSAEGVIVKGSEPTSYGAESVNGKVYRSWSPEFATDADYAKAKCKKGHWTFPDGVRGSEANPAHIVAVNFVTGALTNKPAFKNMPPVKAKKVELESDTLKASGNSEGVRKSWDKRRGGGVSFPIHIGNDLHIQHVGMDTNGNHSVWVSKGEDGRSRKIQTNGNIPAAHDIPIHRPEEHHFTDEGIKQIHEYVEKYHKASDESPEGDTLKAGAPVGNKNAEGKRSEKFYPLPNIAKRHYETAKNLNLPKDTEDQKHAAQKSFEAWSSSGSAFDKGTPEAHDKARRAHSAADTAHDVAGNENARQDHQMMFDLHTAWHHSFSGDETAKATGATDDAEDILKAGAPMGNKNAAGKRTSEKNPAFDDQTRFNWGYHDAAQGEKEGWHTKENHWGFAKALGEKMDKPEDILDHHFDKTYAHGWLHGIKHVKEGKYTGNSQAAWDEHNAKFSKASAATPSPLDTIFARKQDQLAELNLMAKRVPEAQARLKAAEKKPEPIVKTMTDRKQAEREFEAELLSRNPMAKNREFVAELEKRKL